MSVTFYTGRKPALKPALLRAVTEADVKQIYRNLW